MNFVENILPSEAIGILIWKIYQIKKYNGIIVRKRVVSDKVRPFDYHDI